MSYLKIACAAVLVSSMAVANVAMAGNGGVSGSAPGKTATTPGGATATAPGQVKSPGSPATGIGQSNPNKPSK